VLIDPENHVAKLCAAGMQAEAAGRDAEARTLFLQAWAAHRDHYEACIAAHFLARQQATLEETLYWNQVALDHAAAVGDERVHSFYPSLYLNLGRCHELLGDTEQARRCYGRAATGLVDLPAGPYGDLLRSGIARAQARLG
jgi:hypothetical protein